MSLDTILINDITLGRLLLWVGIGFGCYAAVKCYRLLFTRKKVNLQHMVYFTCRNCGWEGHISKFGTRCPKCDTPANPSQ